MDILFYIFLALPAIGFLFTLLIPSYNEKLIASVVINFSALSIIAWLVMVVGWIISKQDFIESHDFYLYSSDHYNYILTFIFDKVNAVYLGIASILSFLITKYCRYYLHKDSGYKRFFTTIALFELSIYIITLAGNFETLFLGWEILGVSSFLLIAFYRDRYLPVRNGVKVYTYYRVADAGLLIAMWIAHHVWHHNIKFVELYDSSKVEALWSSHPTELTIMALLIGLAAAVKSAQFPFSTWLARAMEGPTPSSAIYYGSIAVNIGVFLMLRTYPLWSVSWLVKGFFIGISVVTAIAVTTIGRTQNSVKAQIAYASIGQISLVFIEIALGWHTLALIHFTGNAFLRPYQLFRSPSVITYLMREQFCNYTPPHDYESQLTNKWRNTLLIAGLKEWRRDSVFYNRIWQPLKYIGKIMEKLPPHILMVLTLVIFIISSYFFYSDFHISSLLHHGLALVFSIVAVCCALAGLSSRANPISAWIYVAVAHVWIVIAVNFNTEFSMIDSAFYLSGIAISAIAGYFILRSLQSKYDITLNGFVGLGVPQRNLALVFLLACITMAGFPLSTTFIGEDLLFTHIESDQYTLAFFTVLLYIVEGIALIRMYARIFLGPYMSNQHYFAQRFS